MKKEQYKKIWKYIDINNKININKEGENNE